MKGPHLILLISMQLNLQTGALFAKCPSCQRGESPEVRKRYIRKLGPQGHCLAKSEDLGCRLQGPLIPLLLGKWKGYKLDLWLTSTWSRDPGNPRSYWGLGTHVCKTKP